MPQSSRHPAPPAPTVSREWLAGILTAAERQGVTVDRIAAACAVAPAVYRQPRCPLPLCIATWEAAARLTGDPLFGLHAGGSLLPAQFNLLSHLLAQSTDLAGALQLARRYLPLVSDGGTVALAPAPGGLLQLTYLPLSHGWQYSHHQIDAALLAIVRLVDWLSAGTATPVAVTIARPDQGRSGDYEAAFGCPVRFNSADDAVLLPATTVTGALGHDPLMASHARDRAERALIDVRSASWSARTLRLIATGLAAGSGNRRDVAAALRVSERTLQRRLAAEGRDFAGLLAQLRRELAADYLQAGLSPAETGRLLGYSEPAAFHRAFAGWAGVTPGQYAQRARAERDPRDAAGPAPA